MSAPLLPRAAADTAQGDCRCLCGSLLARLTDRGVELKCRRCKRTLLLSFATRPRDGPGRGGVALRGE